MTAAQFLEMLIVAGLRTYIYKGEFAYVHANLCFFTVSKKKEKSQHGKRELASSSACITSQLGIFNYKRTTTALLESGRIPLLHSTRRERGKDERFLQRMEQMSK